MAIPHNICSTMGLVLTKFLLVFLWDECSAQDIPVSVRAYNIADHTAVSSGALLNTRTKRVGITSEKGSAVMDVRLGDTLVFSHMKYLSDTVVVTTYAPMASGLTPRTIVLDEVVISARRQTPLEQFERNQQLYKSIFLKGDNKQVVQIAPLGISISINKLYSALSKEGKDARRLQHILVSTYEDAVIAERFTPQVVSEVTGLSLDDSSLRDFIRKHPPTFEWIQTATDYDLLRYIKEEFAAYLEREIIAQDVDLRQ